MRAGRQGLTHVTTTDVEPRTGEALLPAAAPAGVRTQRLPLLLWVLVGFLASDAILRGFEVAHDILAGGLTERSLPLRLTDCVTAVCDLLLVLMLSLRLAQARIWGTVYFLLQIGWFVAGYVVQNPDAWRAATTAERLQLTARLFFFTAGAIVLHCHPLTAALRR